MKKYLALIVFALAPLACAQGLKLTVFDRLKDKATEVVDLNLPKNLIDIGTGFLGVDADKLKKMALNSILIRSLEFDKEGVYTNADVQSLISELAGPGWNLVIKVDGKEKSRIWIKSSENGELGGLRILSAESNELSVIEIVGKVRPEDLKDLGSLGIPGINSERPGQPAKKNEE